MEEVYKPSEDSYLLQKYIEQLVSGRVLDMGTGSGLQTVTAASKSEVFKVVAVDINPTALIVAEKCALDAGVLNKVEFVLSDLFARVEGRFDWILFNTPYLPSEGDADEASWAGGETGGEVIRRFLSDVIDFLSPRGTILMVYSSLSGITEDDLKDFRFELLEEIGLFFEKISCVRLNPF